MWLSVEIAAVTCVAMILFVLFCPRVKLGHLSLETYWMVALLGAVTMILAGQMDLPALAGALTENSPINPLKILVLLLSMTVLSIFLDEVGFFRYLASKTLALGGHSQLQLFVILYATVSVLTVFTSNDIIVLTFTPFICYFAKNAQVDPKPYLFAEFVAANTMSMTFLIGNPTNIYIATSYGITFLSYFRVMALPTLAASTSAFAILYLIFRKDLKKPMSTETETVRIRNKPFLAVGIADLAICTVLLVIGSYIGVEMWLDALAAAVALFVIIAGIAFVQKRFPEELKNTFLRAPWQLVIFVLSMFVMILAVSGNGATEWVSRLLGEQDSVFRYGLLSFFSANLMNNIPMSVLFCPIIEPLSGGAQTGAVYATIIGSNLGAYLTPIGALAGIMWMSLLKKHEVRFGYGDFIRYGVLVSLPALMLCLGMLYLEMMI